MQPTGTIITGQFDSTVTGPTPKRPDGQFDGRTTTESYATRETESNRSFDESPTLKDRLIYPFYAAKNRILRMAGIGAKAGIYTPIIAASAICAFAGDVIGSTVGRLIKTLFFPNSEVSPSNLGVFVGICTGALLAIPAAVALGAVAATAFAVIGLAGSVPASLVDIYHAITLDNNADLHPEPVLVKDIWSDIKKPDISQYLPDRE
ncbi:chloride channel protein [Endozoicomonas sp. YOMI1]|uniref:chloride channel protein n=1 Tax=Endozoicomonas sp. YOMI1 TaxID=2828739 RepID=UPI0021489629|nr:chloride channel protein [Endozoicomonas sp. YOMI1]